MVMPNKIKWNHSSLLKHSNISSYYSHLVRSLIHSFILIACSNARVMVTVLDDALPLSGPHAKVFNTECHPLGAWDIKS
jgi:hypothetical protein